jgi:hypothetical protein
MGHLQVEKTSFHIRIKHKKSFAITYIDLLEFFGLKNDIFRDQNAYVSDGN